LLETFCVKYSALVFDQESNWSYLGVISGTGSLQKAGAGTVRFTQSQAYLGDTTISGGAPELDTADLVGDVDVLGGATLTGHGAVGGLVLASGASVAPRTPSSSGFGTLSPASATFAPGSTLDVRVAEGSGNDRLESAGAVTLGSGVALELRPGPGSYATPVSFDVLTVAAGSVSGNFDPGLLPDFAFLDVTLANLGDRIVATLQASGGTPADLARTPNQRAVAETLEALQPGASGDLAEVFDSLSLLTSDEVPVVLDSLAGEILSDFETSRFALARRFDQVIAARVVQLGAELEGEAVEGAGERLAPRSRAEAELPPVSLPPTGETGFGAWLGGLGLSGELEGEDGSADLDYLTGGGTIGLDYRLSPRLAVGGVVGYAHSDLEAFRESRVPPRLVSSVSRR
jgi:outer membrane autotransporter protein